MSAVFATKQADRPGVEPIELDRVVPRVYNELRNLAARYMTYERRNHTLNPTALVHEAFLKLAREPRLECCDRVHFVRIAARAMRQVLVNHAESRRAAKRGGGWGQMPLDHVVEFFEVPAVDLLVLDEAIQGLQELDSTQASIVELRFFGGLTVAETSAIIELPIRTVEREWAMARAYLRRQLVSSPRCAP